MFGHNINKLLPSDDGLPTLVPTILLFTKPPVKGVFSETIDGDIALLDFVVVSLTKIIRHVS